MQLIESRARDLPVVLLIHVAERDRVGEELVEIVHTRLADALRQRDWQLRDPSVRLDLSRVLIHKRSHAVENAMIFYSMALHGVPPSNCSIPCPFPLLTWSRRFPVGVLAASARSPPVRSSRMGR